MQYTRNCSGRRIKQKLKNATIETMLTKETELTVTLNLWKSMKRRSYKQTNNKIYIYIYIYKHCRFCEWDNNTIQNAHEKETLSYNFSFQKHDHFLQAIKKVTSTC